MFDLSGKTALVTGSSRGIGRAIAACFVKSGARVICHGSRDGEALCQTAKELHAPYITGDLAREEEVRKLAAAAEDVDILVLNGSVQSYMGAENFDMEVFTKMINANVAGAFLLIGLLAPKMASRHFGRIIGISSINETRPAARLAVYSATKAALANVIKMTAKEYAASGITANLLQPGVIVTDRNREALRDENFAANLRADIPMHRFGTPEDCAPAVLFLASSEAAYVTGAEIPVSGGWQL